MSDGPIEPPIESAPVGEQQAPPDADNSAQGQTNLPDSESQAGQENSGGNPAWKPILDALPTSLHSQVTPLLQEWDKGVQQRFSAIHDEYKDYKPYKEQGVDPETIQYGLSLVNALNEDPRKVYESMGEYYKFGTPPVDNSQQQQGASDESWMENEDDTDPRITELQEGLKTLAQIIQEQNQEKVQQQEDERLGNELNSLREKYGEYDENYVLGRMLNGDSPEDAVKSYREITDKILAQNNRPAAPKVIGGGGGGVANTSVNPAKLTEAERRELATQYLAKAKQEG